MNAKELLQEWKERCNRLPRTAEEEDYQTILRALSLLAAAEANDGTTPETDACGNEPRSPGDGDYIAMRVVAARLERERNAALRALQVTRRALEDIREEWAGAECGEPVTAQEGYAIGLVKRMYQIAVEGLK